MNKIMQEVIDDKLKKFIDHPEYEKIKRFLEEVGEIVEVQILDKINKQIPALKRLFEDNA